MMLEWKRCHHFFGFGNAVVADDVVGAVAVTSYVSLLLSYAVVSYAGRMTNHGYNTIRNCWYRGVVVVK